MKLECRCGHRLALHTYYKDRSPCTRCRCQTFDELDAVATLKTKISDRKTRYSRSSKTAEEVKPQPF